MNAALDPNDRMLAVALRVRADAAKVAAEHAKKRDEEAVKAHKLKDRHWAGRCEEQAALARIIEGAITHMVLDLRDVMNESGPPQPAIPTPTTGGVA